jgi:hypothetical protein
VLSYLDVVGCGLLLDIKPNQPHPSNLHVTVIVLEGEHVFRQRAYFSIQNSSNRVGDNLIDLLANAEDFILK